MRLRRLWQPRRLLFWQFVLFNLLSSACSWGLRVLPLNAAGMWLLGSLALLNMAFGLLAAWKLVQDDPTGPDPG